MEDGMTTTSILSRRTLVASAAALPALAVPAVASAATARTGASTTLPPELIERFVRVRTWFLDFSRRETLWSDEVNRRLYAATGMTGEQYHAMNCRERPAQVNEAHSIICDEVQMEGYEDEGDDLCTERWEAAAALMAHQPQNIADLAWQLEAFIVADLEITCDPSECSGDRLTRAFFQNMRTLGALQQPDDPLGALTINMLSDDDGAVS
jgi:hypothetical protein